LPLDSHSATIRVKTTRALALLLVLSFGVLETRPAFARHEATNTENSIQLVAASSADVEIAPGTQAVLGGGCGVANPLRKEADVHVVAGTARIGTSTTARNSRITSSASNTPLRLETTSAIYAWSDRGATVHCVEIDR
jgi:hypothetical protein